MGLFAGLRRQLESNTQEVSGVSYPAPTDKLIFPEDFKGAPRDLVFAYLHDTPLEELFGAPIPFAFTDEQRFEHMHIVGGSGHGKTQLLQHLILHDLTRPNPPALIVIDSQGETLRKIRELKLFTGEMADRLVVVDPELYSPALNMFDVSNARTAGYSALHREQIQAGIIELYNYIFASIAAEMTSRQSTAFAFVARLMLTVPGATMHTLRELMEDPAQTIEQSPFAPYIAKLDNTSRSYFQNQFFTRKYADLRQQIARRLYGVLSVPAFDRMFSATENKLDMFEAMQSGKVVLVNTSKSLLEVRRLGPVRPLHDRARHSRRVRAGRHRRPTSGVPDRRRSVGVFRRQYPDALGAGAQVQRRPGARPPTPRPAFDGPALGDLRQQQHQARGRRERS